MTATSEAPRGRRYSVEEWARIQSDPEASQAFTLENIGLVYWTIKRKFRYLYAILRDQDRSRVEGYFSLEDAASAGILGLYRSVEGYNPESGHSFTTYAAWWIWNHIHVEQDRYEAPLGKGLRGFRERLGILRKKAEKGTLTEEERAAYEGLSTKWRAIAGVARLDAPISVDGDGTAFIDTVPVKAPSVLSQLILEEETLLVRYVVSVSCNAQEAQVLRWYGLEEREMKRISKDLGVSKQRGHQIWQRALKKFGKAWKTVDRYMPGWRKGLPMSESGEFDFDKALEVEGARLRQKRTELKAVIARAKTEIAAVNQKLKKVEKFLGGGVKVGGRRGSGGSGPQAADGTVKLRKSIVDLLTTKGQAMSPRDIHDGVLSSLNGQTFDEVFGPSPSGSMKRTQNVITHLARCKEPSLESAGRGFYRVATGK